MKQWYLAITLATCAATVLHANTLPQLPTIGEHINTLQSQLSNGTLDATKKRLTQHELHRLLFVAYLLRNERSKHESRIQAHHAFSTLYHAPSSDQLKLRDMLSSFVTDLYELQMQHISSKARSEAVLARAAQLEEMVMPLLKDSSRGQDALFTFTKSIYKVMVSPRLTRNHYLLYGGMTVAGLLAAWGFFTAAHYMVQSSQAMQKQVDAAISKISDTVETTQSVIKMDGSAALKALAQSAPEAPKVFRWIARAASSGNGDGKTFENFLKAFTRAYEAEKAKLSTTDATT